MRLFFYCATTEKPSGGHKQLRLMAVLLAELGAETFLLRDRRFFADGCYFDDKMFRGVSVPHAPFAFEDAGAHLQADDVVIFPEGIDRIPPLWRTWKCRIALNNQNGFFALRYCPRAADSRSPFEFAIAIAPYVASICKDVLGIPAQRIFQVPPWVVRPPFAWTEERGARRPSICYMPRKLPAMAERVRELVRQTHPDVPWVKIDGLPEEEVARILRDNSIFLALHDLEACPTSGLEAMACGCLVAGYGGTGRFPHPYATSANGLWVPDRDVEAAAAAIRSAIEVMRTDGEKYARYLESARQTAQQFTREKMLTALRDLLETVSSQRYDSRRQVVAGLGWSGYLYAYKLLYDYDRLGWPGHLLSRMSKLTKPLRSAFSRRTTGKGSE